MYKRQVQARGEFAFSLGTSENSLPDINKRTNANVDIAKVLGPFRSHFGAQASNRKANRRANQRSHAATAVIGGVPIELGGQMIRNVNKNHLFENRVDLIKV